MELRKNKSTQKIVLTANDEKTDCFYGNQNPELHPIDRADNSAETA